MKRILITLSVLLLFSAVCLSSQATKSVKAMPYANTAYKASLVNNMKGSVEEAPLAILGPETSAVIIIAKNNRDTLCHLVSSTTIYLICKTTPFLKLPEINLRVLDIGIILRYSVINSLKLKCKVTTLGH